MKISLQVLREAAKKAEPGPWILGGCSRRMITKPDGYIGDGFIADVDTKANAYFIAAANPQTILALLDVVEAAKEHFGHVGCEPANCVYCTAANCGHKRIGQTLAALDGDAK